MGVENNSIPSRKNGRFSGKKSAKRSLAPIWATSDSIWEKSGLIVASMAVLAVGVHFTSRPPSAFTAPFWRGASGSSALPVSLPVA